jgi:hypothetical protein
MHRVVSLFFALTPLLSNSPERKKQVEAFNRVKIPDSGFDHLVLSLADFSL